MITTWTKASAGWWTRAQGHLLDNTLIVFTSDNGGERFSDNWPLVGGKMDLTEGGIRVPWIAHWPAVLRASGVTDQHCMTMDWSATMLQLGNAQAPAVTRARRGVTRRRAATLQQRFDRPLYWRMSIAASARCASATGNTSASTATTTSSTWSQDGRDAPIAPNADPTGSPRCVRSGNLGRHGAGYPRGCDGELGYGVADMPQR